MDAVSDGTLFVKEKAYVCLVVCAHTSKSNEKCTSVIGMLPNLKKKKAKCYMLLHGDTHNLLILSE